MTLVRATDEFHQLDGHQALYGSYDHISASAAALARLESALAHAVQLPFSPMTARPHARTAPPYSRPSGSSTLISTVPVPVAPAGTLTRPLDEPSGQLSPPSQERSIQISSPGAPLEMVAHAMPLS